jgi:protease-4
MRTLLGAHPETTSGKAIGVVTIAGTIIDGDAGPGTAGGARIVDLLNKAYDRDLAALVVRIDSPGGSLMASEHIRVAIERFKAEKDIPVVASMANLGASGGYWVATPAQAIFAEPGTITGSIGVFSVIPTFEHALADFGVTGAGVKTTPLSGQPDILTGFSPELDRMMQLSIESNYDEFVTIVSKSRKLEKNTAESWAEGRPWAGGDARQLKLVDRFGDFDDAIAYAAEQAGLEEGDWHVEDIGGQPDALGSLLRGFQREEAQASAGYDLAGLAALRQEAMLRRAAHDLQNVMAMRGVQALCLECPNPVAAVRSGAESPQRGWIATVAEIFLR